MKKINRKDIITFIIILVITCIIFIPFLQGHYATDTYNVANLGYKEYAIKWSLNDGRIFMSLITLLADKLKLSIEVFVFLTLLLSLIVSNISVLVVKKIIERFKKPQNIWQDILITAIAYVTIFNFMYIEIMYFVESFVISVSVLLFIIAADILVKKEKKSIIKTILITITAVMFYQGTICMFFAMTFLISIFKNKNNIKQIIIDLIKCGIIALIAVGFNIILVKIIGKIFGMKQGRIQGIDKIWDNISRIIQYTYVILVKSCDLFPNYLYFIFIGIIMMVSIFYFRNDKKGDTTIIKLSLLVLMGILSSSVIFILAYTSFYSGRLRLAIGATIGMMFAILYVETNIFENKKIFKYIISGILTAYLAITIGEYLYLMNIHKQVNRLEKSDVEEINEYIENYEKETGKKITKIVKAKVSEKTEKAYYSSIKNQSALTYTAIRSDLAADCVINFYTKRELKTIIKSANERKLWLMKGLENEKGYMLSLIHI